MNRFVSWRMENPSVQSFNINKIEWILFLGVVYVAGIEFIILKIQMLRH
jgi:hypothetical protein